MPGLDQLTAVWKNIKEFELAPIRNEALKELNITIVGAPGSEPARLSERMRRDPNRMGDEAQSPLTIQTLDEAKRQLPADLAILFIEPGEVDYSVEQALCREWGNHGKKVVLLCDSKNPAQDHEKLRKYAPWNASALLCGPIEDHQWLLSHFVPTVLKLLPDSHLALGRQFPLFRVPIARQLIHDTCYTNAAYALGSGLAEVVPVLNVPLNITDMIVLTKAQAFLVYRLGLLLGFSTAWQDYLAEFGSVIGSGFVWRQLARYLVGLIPIWGIAPKVAVAYAGTFVVGNTVLQWYLTGRHLSPRQVRDLYRQALAQGKQTAQSIVKKLPKPRLKKPGLRLPRRKQTAALPTPQEILLMDRLPLVCAHCGSANAPDARFCQYCGHAIAPSET
jgi:uncharacterized protein (DUF697 family)